MKALVFNGPRDIRCESFRDPELPSENGAIVKVRKCSICGSDLHIYHGDSIGATRYGSDLEPFCVGHEFIGEIVEVGPQAHGLKVGDAVLAAGGAGCGRCVACRTGRPLSCRSITAFGIGPGLQGGQAEYVAVPNADSTLLKTEGAFTDEQAMLLTDAMATAYFGVTRADVRPGGRVAVTGLGPIGLIGVELAFLFGASTVFAIDPVAARRAKAEALGATALAPGADAIAAVRDATSGGADSVFEASGASASIDSALKLVRHGGTVSFIGLPQPHDALSMRLLLFKNVTARAGVATVQEQWSALAPLVRSGRLKAAGLFTHALPLDEGAEAYRLFDSRDDGVLKVMIEVG